MRMPSITMALMLGQILAAPLAHAQGTAEHGAVPSPSHPAATPAEKAAIASNPATDPGTPPPGPDAAGKTNASAPGSTRNGMPAHAASSTSYGGRSPASASSGADKTGKGEPGASAK